MTTQAASHVYFGLNPMWVSTCILAVTYATIMSEKVNRAIIALVGAGGEGTPGRDIVHLADHDRGALRIPR
jgi:hypothetical protein